MKALTIIPPWPWFICRGLKPVENRTWRPSERQLRPGDELAIHAGKMPSDRRVVESFDWIVGRGLWSRKELPYLEALQREAGAVVAVATYAGTVTEHPSGWFAGPYGWIWSRLVVLPSPVPCPGLQGLWTLPGEVEAMVRGQMDRAA